MGGGANDAVLWRRRPGGTEAGGTPALHGSSLAPPRPRSYAWGRPPPMKPAITLFTVAAALFIALGVNRVLEQKQQLAGARPIPATVNWSNVQPVKGEGPLRRR